MAEYFPKISILGDSISTFAGYTPSGGVFYAPESAAEIGVSSVEDTWWMRVIHAWQGSLLCNHSWSGSTVCREGLLAACSVHRLRRLSDHGKTPDIILIFTGLNDVALYFPPEDFGREYGEMLQMARDLYPRAGIACGTLLEGYRSCPGYPLFAAFGNSRIAPYNRAIRGAARRSGCLIADLAAQGRGYSSLDGIHPDGEGMRTLAQLWCRCLPDGVRSWP